MATPELSNRHRDTLDKIFRHPASGNVDWRHVVSLLDAVGTIEEDDAMVVETKGSLHDEVLAKVRADRGASRGGLIGNVLGSGAVVVFGPA